MFVVIKDKEIAPVYNSVILNSLGYLTLKCQKKSHFVNS